MFLGASAIANDGWLTSYDVDEARLNSCMAARTSSLSILTEHQKFGSRATYNVFKLSDVANIITDQQVDDNFKQYFTDNNIKLTTVSSEPIDE